MYKMKKNISYTYEIGKKKINGTARPIRQRRWTHDITGFTQRQLNPANALYDEYEKKKK